MKASILFPILLLAASAATDAATVTQSADFPIELNFATTAGLGVIVPASYFSKSVSPFDTSLGTLTGVTLTWDMTGGFSGTTGPGGGGFSITYIGDFYVNDMTIARQDGTPGVINGGGGGGGGGGPLFDFSGTFPAPTPFVTELTAADAVFGSFTGAAPVTLDWAAPITYSGVPDITNLTVSGNASVVVTYTYTVVPEPASALLVAGSALLTLRRRRR